MRVFDGPGDWPHLYHWVVRTTVEQGSRRPSRDGMTLDMGPITIVSSMDEPFTTIRGRGGSARFARVERLTYLAGETPDVLAMLFPSYAVKCGWEPGKVWHGAYGPRLLQPLDTVVDLLSEVPNTRQAVAMVWRAQDIVRPSNGEVADVPCTVALTFWTQTWEEDSRTLHLHVQMRSCDVWLGLYYDLPAFAYLGRRMAQALGLAPGRVELTTTSLHIYGRDLDEADKLRPMAERALFDEPFGVELVDGSTPVERWRSLVSQARIELANIRSASTS